MARKKKWQRPPQLPARVVSALKARALARKAVRTRIEKEFTEYTGSKRQTALTRLMDSLAEFCQEQKAVKPPEELESFFRNVM